MSLYDNKYWLLSHIRNSFISTDDTGMCELIMVGESKDAKQHLRSAEPYPEPEGSEDEEDEFELFDMHQDMDFSIRERSNTAAQLEKLEHARKKTSKMKHVKWETKDPVQEFEDIFVKKDITQLKDTQKRTSTLAALLQTHSNVPRNPFIEYAKFDGSGQVNIPTKKYKIYLTMLPQEQRNYPMQVCCVASAKVQDLIGLVLLKHSYNHGITNLKSPSQYGLYITEEDGEVDRDFPCLDAGEPISKFGFTSLGLVEHKEAKAVNFQDASRNSLVMEGPGRTRTISDKSKAEESRQMENDLQAVEDHNKQMEAPLYRAFRAVMVSKVKPKIEVTIGISGERVEIDPVPQKGSKLLPFKAKAISHPVDSIASCEMIDTRSSRTGFRIVYCTAAGGNASGDPGILNSPSTSSAHKTTAFKHYYFESDYPTALDIVQKINLILELKSSATRSEYIASREKKMVIKKVFNIVK
ncbi:unnamed protein product [Phaedon cochleariae]|uniref:Target of rapamycin complex 2 subunit MAPKAP1 n=1 Tax=Phaedon cochleariae TaxID=80249 RepID=A0A9N9X2E5_PHACE|nr:unnamed protein product [Phaedon cochleariae]